MKHEMKIAALLSAVVFAAMLATSPPGFAGENEDEQQTTGTLTVGIWVDITLSNVPIGWGTLTMGTENNLANADAGNPATVTVESTTNTDVDIYIKGTNWAANGNVIGVDNCHYNTENTSGGDNWTALSTSYATGPDEGYFEDVAPGESKNTYWFIDIPIGQTDGLYTNTIYFKAVKDGDTP